jgi:prepilin-type N-terminal cleavage/methylation domain-containing protein
MRPRNNASRGYTIIEILVVVAIIGIMSLVTVPAMVNFQRANTVKAALRSFTSDIRNCRQRAISRNSQVRLELDSSNTYRFYELPNAGAWGALNGFSGTGAGRNMKKLDNSLTFSSNGLGDTDSNSKKDMVFRPDGTADFGPGGAGSITMQSDWKGIAQNQFLIEISTSGKLKTTGSHS